MKSNDIIKIPFNTIKDKLLVNKITIHHAVNNPNIVLSVNKDILLESNVTFWGFCNTLWSMGCHSYSGSNLGYGVKVGRFCSIAVNVSIMGAHHFPDWISTSPVFYNSGYHNLIGEDLSNIARQDRNIEIGNDVWIGSGVVLKSHLKIGNGAIIAANSVVTKDVPPFAIVGGNPARIIRFRFSDDLIQKIQQIEWWNYHLEDFKGLNANNPEQFIDELNEKVLRNNLKHMAIKSLTLSDLQV